MFKFDRKVKNRERKKKGPVWILIYLCLGGFIGTFIGGFIGGYSEKIQDMIVDLGDFIYLYAFEIYVSISLALLAITVVTSLIGRKKFLKSIAKDDEVYDEELMSVGIGATSLTIIFNFLLLIPAIRTTMEGREGWKFITSLLLLLFIIVICALIQNKLIEDMKKGYPEKRGDVYDMSFKKDLIDSFDEREISHMHEAGYRAFEVASKLMIFLTIGLILLSVIIKINLGLIFSLLAIMATMNITYICYCIKLENNRA